jgi:hypothetical protein
MKTELNSSADQHEIVRTKRQRSRITNGKTLLPDVDGRGAWTRRCKDVISAHLQDIGADTASAAERSLIRRAAVMTTELERIEVRFATDEAAADDLDLYQRTAGNLRRILESVGLKRVPRDVTTLGDLIRADLEQQRQEEPGT